MQIKSKPGSSSPATHGTTLSGIDEIWFKKTNELLTQGIFKYPKRRQINIPKPGQITLRSLSITNGRIKIIEKAMLNSLETLFEGTWFWKKISEKAFDKIDKDPLISKSEYKRTKEGFFKKKWTVTPIFKKSSYGFRPNRCALHALADIK